MLRAPGLHDLGRFSFGRCGEAAAPSRLLVFIGRVLHVAQRLERLDDFGRGTGPRLSRTKIGAIDETFDRLAQFLGQFGMMFRDVTRLRRIPAQVM